MLFSLPFAVHISDGLLAPTWLIGGFLLAGLFALWGGWRIREEEIPRIALLTAAFFVASSIHVPIPSGSVHLLLSGLVGLVLGRRAALAIPIGLAMQASPLLNHGGVTTIGVNSCIQIVPALVAWQLFVRFRWMAHTRRPGWQAGLVGLSIFLWTLSLVFSLVLLVDAWSDEAAPDLFRPLAFVLNPITLTAAALLSIGGMWAERRMGNPPEFPLGLLIGEGSVLLAVTLKCLVLVLGGEQDWRRWALAELVGHLPIAVIEGVILGFTIGFLTRVKPEMLAAPTALRETANEEAPCLTQ
jgi:ABC-type Co2+ transport system permease subunit